MRVPVNDLVGAPGATRSLRESVVRADVDGIDEWGPATDTVLDPVVLDLRLESVVEGILVRGTVDIDLQVPCARCLTPQRLEDTVAVAELYLDPRRDEDEDAEAEGDGEPDLDAYRIDDDLAHLDLGPLLRDTVVMDVPVRVLCREDCQGLCPECGADRNETDCGHRPDDAIDPRWAALADLDLPS